MDIVVTDDADAQRFVARAEGDVAGFVEYRLRNSLISLTHTEVAPAFQGAGVAGRLARAALDTARSRALGVVPLCPYIRGYIVKHPEYRDLVPAADRARFDLEGEG